jgi:tRNA pseudouridine55 synthase
MLDDVVFQYPDLPENFERAVLPVDKPHGWSSFDVIRKLRRVLGTRKIGHAGTLDPMATGLLIVLVGRATKLMEQFMLLPKTYEGTLRLGESTPTYDAESEVVIRRETGHIEDYEIEAARRRFLGDIEQRAPAYSALKVGGERLYKKVRRGEDVEPPVRLVRIDEFELTSKNGADISFRVTCSKGTYIRSLAHDFGEALGVGAHLFSLRRLAIGPYRVEDAWSLERLEGARKETEPDILNE